MLTRSAFAAVLAALATLPGGAAGAQTHALSGLSTDELTLGEARVLSSHAEPKLVAHTAASWCGSAAQADQSPNTLAGNPAHWIYVVPSDGADLLSTYGSAMQSDAEAIEAWWLSQDATRSPRNDLAQFSCGTQLDITSIRVQQSSAQLRPQESRFETLVIAALGAGFDSSFDKYIVYYDGPAPSDVCGEGGSFSNGLGFAIVYVQACSGVPASLVAVHELVHTYGAVPSGAPHMCESPNAFHVCDSDRDLMYPFADGTPLSGLSLDVGRDDYYGHNGGWLDIQDSPWLVQRDRQAQLDVTIAGQGSVTADVPGLQCAQSCTTTWNADTRLELTPSPTPGFRLVRFGGACSGSSQCFVSVKQPTSVSALFAPETYRLTVAVSGKGTVRSAAVGIACPGRCSARATSYSPLRLTAKPTKGWRLKTWRGSCRGTRALCTVPMSTNTSARAVFARR
jgi:hypothetical protein